MKLLTKKQRRALKGINLKRRADERSARRVMRLMTDTHADLMGRIAWLERRDRAEARRLERTAASCRKLGLPAPKGV